MNERMTYKEIKAKYPLVKQILSRVEGLTEKQIETLFNEKMVSGVWVRIRYAYWRNHFPQEYYNHHKAYGVSLTGGTLKLTEAMDDVIIEGRQATLLEMLPEDDDPAIADRKERRLSFLIHLVVGLFLLLLVCFYISECNRQSQESGSFIENLEELSKKSRNVK